MNQIIERKKERIRKIKSTIRKLKEKGKKINKKTLINFMIVEEIVSKKTATEEVEAVIDYYG